MRHAFHTSLLGLHTGLENIMGSHLIWLPLLLLIYYMEQVQGNHKMHGISLKPGQPESGMGSPVISVDLNTKFHNRLCKCKVNGRWEEKNFCPCTKSVRRNKRRENLRKLCKGTTMKRLKKCHFFNKKQRKHGPSVPF